MIGLRESIPLFWIKVKMFVQVFHLPGISVKRVFAALGILLFLCPGSAAVAQEQTATAPAFASGYLSIKVFDNQARFVGRILPEKRYWASIDQIPLFLQNALVAIEDARFYEHKGIDLQGMARALVKDVIKGRMAEGGSTITQQLIKNKYFSGKKTIERKVKEGFLALEYERKYNKKQILEMYFNEVYFGNGAWGIVQAARLYFDKYPQELTNAECALLAGVPKAPARYNPLGKPPITRARKDFILKRMAELKMITPAQEKQLRVQPISVVQPREAPYYLAHIRNKLIERYGADIIEQGGLEVITAMDLNLQKLAERFLGEGVGRISPQIQGALLSLDPYTGDVLAAVGGTDFKRSPYNRAFFAKRQPGSAIKPLIYAAALEKGLTAGSIWNDDPVSYPRNEYETWKPENYGKEHYGDLPLRQALAHSDNIITVKLLEVIGVPHFVRFAGGLGLSLRSPNDLSLALGTDEVTLSDLMLAYAPLANGGARPEPRTIIRIYERYRDNWMEIPPAINAVLSPAVAYITTSMLKDVLVYGTAKSLLGFSREYPAAGKTGTTDEYRDAWFIGYTPHLITGVWVGYDKPTPMGKGFTGGAVCAPIWDRFMREALIDKPAIDFFKPDSVISVQIDPATGDLATPGCPKNQEEFYVAGTQPTVYCPIHGGPAQPPGSLAPAPEPPPTDELSVPSPQQ
jgi:1A family penicillin-binding protein